MDRLVNPYLSGAPQREERAFFGRRDTLDWAAQALRDPGVSALFLFGQRCIGKTSLLLRLERILPGDAFLPVYFDLQGQVARPLKQVLAGLAGALAGRAGLQPPGSNLFDGDQQGDFFRHTFLPRFCAVALGENRRLVFLLDEFEALDEADDMKLPETAAGKALFPFLREVGAGDSRTAFVFAAGRQARNLGLAAAFDDPLVREVRGLDWESAGELVRQAEFDGTLQFSALAVSHVLSFSNGHPYLTQLLCQQIWERAYADSPTELPLIDTLAVEQAVPGALEIGGRALAWLWDGLAPAEKIYAAALAEIASAGDAISPDGVCRAIAERAAWLHKPEVEVAPVSLGKRWLLEQAGRQEYGFAVELFRLWVYQNKPLRVVEDEVGWKAPPAELEDDAPSVRSPAPLFLTDEQVLPEPPGAASLDVFLIEQEDDPEEAPEDAARTVFLDVAQWTKWVGGAFGEGRFVGALRLVIPVIVTPVLSAIVFYAIGVSLARVMSLVAWMPDLFDVSTFYRFGLISAVLGAFAGLQFSREFVRRPVFDLELVYLSLYRFSLPFLAVILIYGLLALLSWVSQVTVSEDEWEGFRIFFGWLRRLWERSPE